MQVIEQTLDGSLAEFLARPLFAWLAQRSGDGPRLSPLWFLWEDDAVWHIAQLDGRSYPERVRAYPRTAVGVVDFDASTGSVEHVGIRGTATLVPYDEPRAGRLLETYLGADRATWPERFRDLDPDAYRLIRVDPDTVVARDQSYPVSSNGTGRAGADGATGATSCRDIRRKRAHRRRCRRRLRRRGVRTPSSR